MKKNILDVAPQLATHFIDIEDFSEIRSNVFEVSESEIGKYCQCLGLLHDSWILETEITADNFILTLNDYTTYVFASALIARKGLKIRESKLVFKININFNIQALTFNTVDDNGLLSVIKPVKIHEYLYEEIISITDGVIKIGLVVWVKGYGRKPGRTILILIDAKNVSLVRYQNKDWQSVFDNSYDTYYDRFKAELLKGRYLSDQSICEKLIDEIDINVG
jgi:hypothetical protein